MKEVLIRRFLKVTASAVVSTDNGQVAMVKYFLSNSPKAPTAWKADQEAAKTQALINGALAIVRALATVNYPASLVVAAAYAVSTALQIPCIS